MQYNVLNETVVTKSPFYIVVHKCKGPKLLACKTNLQLCNFNCFCYKAEHKFSSLLELIEFNQVNITDTIDNKNNKLEVTL